MDVKMIGIGVAGVVGVGAIGFGVNRLMRARKLNKIQEWISFGKGDMPKVPKWACTPITESYNAFTTTMSAMATVLEGPVIDDLKVIDGRFRQIIASMVVDETADQTVAAAPAAA